MRPQRVLMTLDAVGGVWRHVVDLAGALARNGTQVLLAGQGPAPAAEQRRELAAIPGAELVWMGGPLDWMAVSEAELAGTVAELTAIALDHRADLLHLHLPGLAVGLPLEFPVVAAAHSCVLTWWEAMRGTRPPPEWDWHRRRNRAGFERADIILAPSTSYADAMVRCYGPIARLHVLPNAVAPIPASPTKEPFILAAGRWWDEAKNGIALDRAAAGLPWPVLMAGSLEGPHGQSFRPHHAEALGPMAHERLAGLVGRAAIFASPSLCEPFGLAALEAAAAGAALLLADIPTYRELWDGVAIFADARDPAAFGHAARALIADPNGRAVLGRRAQRRAEQFSLQRQLDSVAGFYAMALGHSMQRPLDRDNIQ